MAAADTISSRRANACAQQLTDEAPGRDAATRNFLAMVALSAGHFSSSDKMTAGATEVAVRLVAREDASA